MSPQTLLLPVDASVKFEAVLTNSCCLLLTFTPMCFEHLCLEKTLNRLSDQIRSFPQSTGIKVVSQSLLSKKIFI